MEEAQIHTVPTHMSAARLHSVGSPLEIDRIPVPEARPGDVLVKVSYCGVVPNMRRVVGNFFGTQTSDRKLFPRLPAIFGLDAVGCVARLGERVTGVEVGKRVYVNPARSCGSCRMCRAGLPLECPDFTYQGYFGRSTEIMAAYPYGGFAQYITAPATALVGLQDNVIPEGAARLGYLGTAFAAMKRIGVRPGQILLINGISGMLGFCAAMIGLAMGASKILGTGRNMALLQRVKALSPDRIHVIALAEDTIQDGASDPLLAFALSHSDDYGVDGVIDCLPPGAPAQLMNRAIHCLRRGGSAANVGAVTEPLGLDPFWIMTNRITLTGSAWFTTAEGEEIVGMVNSGLLNLSPLEHKIFPLVQINEALSSMESNRSGGFANYVIDLGHPG